MNYEVVLENFKKFLEKFDSKESMINMKVSHSYHVVGLASILAKRLNLEEEKVVFAKVLGLLHDLGRFYQYQIMQEPQQNICFKKNILRILIYPRNIIKY